MSSVYAMLEARGLLTTAADLSSLHHVTLDAAIGSDRFAPVVRARHAIWALMHKSGMTMASIAREWGADRKTVSSALDKRAPAARAPSAQQARLMRSRAKKRNLRNVTRGEEESSDIGPPSCCVQWERP